MTILEKLAVKPGVAPMEARLVDALPEGANWRYEPKWDGFRCLAFKADDTVELRSKAGKPLGRYFPEVVAFLQALPAGRIVLDGELIVPVDGMLSFDALQMRLHPAESRIRRLSGETPAQLMLFDRLIDDRGHSLLAAPLKNRRRELERLFDRGDPAGFRLSPFTEDVAVARSWLAQAGGALDGVVAKDREMPYEPGERVMLKVKNLRTADCVVGGFRYGSGSAEVASLLLGLYNASGRLDHVGFTSSIPAGERLVLTARLEALIEPPGFTGRSPGGPSRWSTERSGDWQPLRAELVVEVRYDHVTGDRFRHGTRLLRWRPDKAPAQCRIDQLQSEAGPGMLATMIGLKADAR